MSGIPQLFSKVKNLQELQPIGKINGVEKAVILYYDICKMAKTDVFSMYQYLADMIYYS
jgi:hypothetical protein